MESTADSGRMVNQHEPFQDAQSRLGANAPDEQSSLPQRDAYPHHTGGKSDTTSIAGRLRGASMKFEESAPGSGMWDVSGALASSIPSIGNVRRGSYTSNGKSDRRNSHAASNSIGSVGSEPRRSFPATHISTSETPGLNVAEATERASGAGLVSIPSHTDMSSEASHRMEDAHASGKSANTANPTASTGPYPEKGIGAHNAVVYDNGYEFPPKHSWGQATTIFLQAFWKFATTWFGFLVIIYGLNVVAWGAMIFFLLLNAAPAMCYPDNDCNYINSPRRIWVEYDSQILTALFCVTAFGLLPWRARDLWYLMQYRLFKNQEALRRLAGIHRGWFRLRDSNSILVTIGPAQITKEFSTIPAHAVPYPISSIPDAPLTGVRAPPTALWKLDFVIWMYMWNTIFQTVLCGLMWGMNRYDRPSWSTGLFVALGCIVAGVGGIMVFIAGKGVKSIEGVPISVEDQERLQCDRELGIFHYNNIKDAAPKEHSRS